jgi:glycosyltransferase involved in cell wall biosynthesis
MPRVSIIIPVYNAARFLRDTLASALRQDVADKEIIVVDDGSADDSLAIARQFASDQVRVFSQINRGASSARNRGLAEARGEFIQFLDADDLLAPNKISEQLRAVENAPSTLASGRWGVFTMTPADAVFTDERMYHSANPIDWLTEAWTNAGMMQPGCWLVPRALLDRAGPWNESLSLDDDGEYFGRVILASSGVTFVPSALTYYRRHSGERVSAIRGERGWRSSFSSCELKEKALLSVENSVRTRRACASNYARFAWENFPESGDYARRAIARWHALDASVRPPAGGPREALVARYLGWRWARRWQKLRRRTLQNSAR